MVGVNFRSHLPQLNHWNVGGNKRQFFQSFLYTESDFFFLCFLSGRNHTMPVLRSSCQAKLPNSFWIRTPHIPGAVQGSLENPQVSSCLNMLCVSLKVEDQGFGPQICYLWASLDSLWPCSSLTPPSETLELRLPLSLSSRVTLGRQQTPVCCSSLSPERMYRPNGLLSHDTVRVLFPLLLSQRALLCTLGKKTVLEADGCLLS